LFPSPPNKRPLLQQVFQKTVVSPATPEIPLEAAGVLAGIRMPKEQQIEGRTLRNEWEEAGYLEK